MSDLPEEDPQNAVPAGEPPADALLSEHEHAPGAEPLVAGSPESAVDLAAAELDVQRQLGRMTRRGFATAAIAASATYGAWHWLRSRPMEGGVEWPFRRAMEMNEALTMAYFRRGRLSPQFRRSQITSERINGGLGLTPHVDADSWRVRIEGLAGGPAALSLDDIRAFPSREMITELRCIEGWSVVVQWAGVRLADVLAKFPAPAGSRYVALETPDRGYYVGLDMQSALHPQTLLAYEMNGRPLTWQHGAPLRLAIPLKYGVKNIKGIGTIRYAAIRPADYWGERGYDWYVGH